MSDGRIIEITRKYRLKKRTISHIRKFYSQGCLLYFYNPKSGDVEVLNWDWIICERTHGNRVEQLAELIS